MVAKNSPWRLGNVQLVLIVAVVEVYLKEDSFHSEIKKISARRKVRHLLANSFEVYQSPAGDQLRNSGHQN